MRLALDSEDGSVCLLYDTLFHSSSTTEAADNHGPARCIADGLSCHFVKPWLAPEHRASLDCDSAAVSSQMVQGLENGLERMA